MTEYIRRELQTKIEKLFDGQRKNGVILAGIVGCGKTTLITELLKSLKKQYEIFTFSGDDTSFRASVALDSKYIFNHIFSRTQKKSLVFVDEVQKTAEAFDALKYAFDHGNISFIVSGSNPHFLNTTAKQRLQRRAEFINVLPFSLPELIQHYYQVDMESCSRNFSNILFDETSCRVDNLTLTLTKEITRLIDRYLAFGGLPLAVLAKSDHEALSEIRKVVERGFESFREDAEDKGDIIRIELAKIHAKEFSYKTIFNKTGLKKRDVVNAVVNNLINHGYLTSKKPMFFDSDKRSYLSVFSYTDTGVLSYLLGHASIDENLGGRVEGFIHTRLKYLLSFLPLKSQLGYFKPHVIDASQKTRYLSSEIDFVVTVGRRIVPIEVKATFDISKIEVPTLKNFVDKHRLPYGIVLYGGVPFCDKQRKIIFWPYWLV